MIFHLVIVKHAWQSIKKSAGGKISWRQPRSDGIYLYVYVYKCEIHSFKCKWHVSKLHWDLKYVFVYSAKCLLLHISSSKETTSLIKIVSWDLKLASIFNLHRSYYKYISVSIKAVSLLTTYRKSNSIITFAMPMVVPLLRFKGHWQLA